MSADLSVLLGTVGGLLQGHSESLGVPAHLSGLASCAYGSCGRGFPGSSSSHTEAPGLQVHVQCTEFRAGPTHWKRP